jgi:hypothetical protein
MRRLNNRIGPEGYNLYCSIEGWGAAIAAGALVGGVAGSAISAGGAEAAAGQQAGAAEQAQQISANEFNTITGQEQPFLQAGQGALSQLNYLQGIGTPGAGGTAASSPAGNFGSLNAPFTAGMMQQYSPAYQFQLQQGQQGTLNQDSASQGALSGSSLKDLISFNQNYANTAYNNAFNQYQTQQQNTFGRLQSIAGIGSSAAANLGAQGVQLAGQQAQSATNIGTAQAAGTVGAANSISSGLGSLGALYGLTQGQAGGFNQSIAQGNNVISNANAVEQQSF